jgi:hypothetical protein
MLIWTSETQVMAKRKAGSQTASLREKDSRPLKVGNRPDLLGCRPRATYRWKALDEDYNFALDHIAIGGLHKKLWGSKVAGVLAGGISGLPCESPGTKSHLDVASVESHRVYYKGEGGDFPKSKGESVGFPKGEGAGFPKGVRWWLTPKSEPWQVPTPKGVPNAKLTSCGWFLGCKGVRWWLTPESGPW